MLRFPFLYKRLLDFLPFTINAYYMMRNPYFKTVVEFGSFWANPYQLKLRLIIL